MTSVWQSWLGKYYTPFSCSVAIKRIYINVPMAIFVPLTAAFTNQKTMMHGVRSTSITLRRVGTSKGRGKHKRGQRRHCKARDTARCRIRQSGARHRGAPDRDAPDTTGRQTGMRILIEINRGTWTEVWGNRLVLCFVERWEGPRRVPQAGTVSPQHWRLAGGSLESPSMETPLSTWRRWQPPAPFLRQPQPVIPTKKNTSQRTQKHADSIYTDDPSEETRQAVRRAENIARKVCMASIFPEWLTDWKNKGERAV